MSNEEGKHVFISYVREDAERVDGLCDALEAAQIPYWRDRNNLGPGDSWKAKIRTAIRDGALVFLACFSDKSRSRSKSYMNEELTLAVEEFRRMAPGSVWLIPVRFDDGEVPEWDLGGGRVLSDLNYADLFGKEYVANTVSLTTKINNLLGGDRPDPATALAAVEQAKSADRPDLLKRLTKDMLLDPTRRIELHDLITQEVQTLLAALKDDDRVAQPLGDTSEEQILRLVQEAQDLWALSAPFCASLQVASQWGDPEALKPWTSGVQSFIAAATKTVGGKAGLIELRHLPGLVSVMTATLACLPSGKWANLNSLVITSTVRGRTEQRPSAIVEATDLYRPFRAVSDQVTNTLARATITGRDINDVLKDFTERGNGNYHTPGAEWLHHVLRPLFSDQLPDDDTYDAEFDRAEVMLGALAEDQQIRREAANPQRPSWSRSHWYGRATWRANNDHGNAVADLMDELDTQGAHWGPLTGGLFGGDEGRARAALNRYQATFNEVARRRF
jgi:hypothetical protein